ncbi:general secretion pathway protein GspB [Ideonella azotifigens]|uniref:Type II secretion system protein GspB C-terminal domain-containing protein n=1 Tax=Ideonella azotifigens TaxID=513160 RepID=A0ABN1K2B0_9BURK|nr:general secretion pathway protein GspB [Ideonella azotifigens]MCD2343804.1 general secretion pathway protein GspB [Ideonella azotifigens]
MSYILDALRRAEADRERERGQVPGLHTQPLPGSEPVPAMSSRRWLPWAGGGLLLLAGVGAGSWWTQREPAAPVSAPAPAPQVAAPVEAPVISAAPVPVPAPTAPPAAQPVVSVPAPAASSIYLPTPAPAPVVTPVPVKPRTATVPEAPQAPSPALTAAPPAPAPQPAAADTRVPLVSELPESLRRELPKLAISGSVYSDDPASRFLIVNGEVLHEGAKLGAELVLEQIRPHELVLRFKGQRYRQPV